MTTICPRQHKKIKKKLTLFVRVGN